MFSPAKMLQQAKKMQEDMQKLQSALGEQVLDISNAGGAIKIKVDGHGNFLDLKLDPEFLKEDAQDVAQALLSAIQEASKKAKATAQEAMKGVTGGLNIPGLSNLF